MTQNPSSQSSREQYRELCQTEPSIPVFSQDWYLDAVCGEKNWDVTLVEKKGKIVASLPYYIRLNTAGFRILCSPPLTQCLGPWVKYPESQKYESKLSYEKEMYTALIDRLPDFSYFSQAFHVRVNNWLPFYWRGFEQTTRYTYRLDLTLSTEDILASFKSNARSKIRKATKLVKTEYDLGIKEFYNVNKLTFKRQKLKIPYDFKLFSDLDQALEKRDKRKMFFAVDTEKNLHSALYLIWDSEAAYVHYVGESPEYRSSGAGIYLIWEAIQYAKDKLLLSCFDYEGSMLETVEGVRRACGGVQTPYSKVTKVNSRMLKVADAVRRAVA